MLRMDTNVMIYEFDIGWNVENVESILYRLGFDCLSDLDTNVKDRYKCHDGL